MEGRCQLTAKQAMSNCGQNANNGGVSMATSHGSPPPNTCHTEFSVENNYTFLDTRAHHESRGGWEEANQRQSDKARQSKTTMAKLHSNGTTAHARSDHPLANNRSPS